jgi:diguanylate cyclase (GGDEF)-like protein
MDNKLNKLAEFKNKELESTFFRNDINSNIKMMRYIAVLFTWINFLFVIYDYLFLTHDMYIIIHFSLIPRTIIVMIAAVIFMLTKKPGNSGKIRWLQLYVLFISIMHLYQAYHFGELDYVNEIFSLFVALLCIQLIPNRLQYTLIISVMTCAIYVVFFKVYMKEVTDPKLVLAITNFSWIILILTLFTYRINKHKRMSYIKELQLEELVNTDYLTKSHNRVACDNILDRMCSERCQFALIIFDIDNFKNINDTYGHKAGDTVIVNIVNRVRKAVRKDDIVARWGGEEFVIILPDTDLSKATELAKRVKEIMANIKHEHIKERITASFGVTVYDHGDDTGSVVNRADQLLYLAKQYGRNRVVSG